MERTFFISDTHFFHTNCLLYEPSRINLINNNSDIVVDIEQLKSNQEYGNKVNEIFVNILINKWNATVRPNDFVWFLGDFGFRSKEKIAEVISKLNGRKRLIRGNHDNFSDEWYRQHGFEFVSKYPVVLKGHFVLSHTPINGMKYIQNMFFIYGHVHSNDAFETITENSQCVCVERQSFAPCQIYEFDSYQVEDKNNENKYSN